VKFSSQDGLVSLRARHVKRGAVGMLAGTWPGTQLPSWPTPEFTEFLDRSAHATPGIGSPRRTWQAVQAFTQIDQQPWHRKFEGTGLGLAMVKQSMTELLGGTVAVASKGTRSLLRRPGSRSGPPPAPPANAAAPAPERRASPRGQPTHGTGVEDDDDAADLVPQPSCRPRASLSCAHPTPNRAWRWAPQQDLDLITVDAQLPGTDGWAFLASIRRTRHPGQGPVVVISGTSDGPIACPGGAAALLEKPLSRSALKKALTDLGFHE